MKTKATSIAPVYNNNALTDIYAETPKGSIAMLGPAGIKREEDLAKAFLNALRPNSLPVLLGSGFGAALELILKATENIFLPNTKTPLPIAVVDKEEEILKHTNLQKNISPRVCWINEKDPQNALAKLGKWQCEHNGLAFSPCLLPFYQRLDKDYYAILQQSLLASGKFNFWEKVRRPRFDNDKPKILLMTSKYFLVGELTAACEEMGIDYKVLTVSDDEMLTQEFIEHFLKTILEFGPDFALTINHLGVDREGVVTELLAKVELPIASWFVDNPHLVLYQYANLSSPWVSIFTWDADNIASLKENGFDKVFYLPLATTPARFSENPPYPPPDAWNSDISFVGNSMFYKVAHRLKAARPGKNLLRNYKQIAADFSKHDERSVYSYLQTYHKELLADYNALKDMQRKLAFETLITWEATRQYRNSCVEKILPYNPLILGDKGWNFTFNGSGHSWRWHPEIAYYNELPHFYPKSTINFNCTSKQMKGAVNQRIFDVPMAGAFVLTDWRDQMGNLFEPEKEVAFYHEPDEIPELVNFYLKNGPARAKIIQAARARILGEHTYTQRLSSLIEQMRKIYGS